MSLILTIGLNSFAGSVKEYKTESLELLTYVASNCPDEMRTALLTPAYVSSVIQTSETTKDGYEEQMVIKTSTYGNPFFHQPSKEVAVVTISRHAPLLMPADGGPQWKTDCSVKRNF